MSFNFNPSGGLGAANAPGKPFGFSFGGSTSTAPSFGASTTTTASAFGQQPSAFGATSGFGAPSTGFGGATNVTPSFGFGAPTTSAPTISGFGGFGSSTGVAAPTQFGGFGTAATTTTASTGFSGFGAGGGFGTGFGTATTSAPAFGGFGSTAGQPSTGFSGFGSSFGQKPNLPSTGFGGFGSSFGQPQAQFQQPQQQQQPPPMTADEAFAQSIFKVNIFGDERDTIIAKWNYLQAMWGTGKAFYSQSNPPVEITPQNYLCRFKTMGYSKLPGKDNKMGFVALIFNRSLAQVKEQQQQILLTLNQIFGNKPNLTIHMESDRSLSENKCQIVIYVEEKSMTTNETKRILATELNAFLNQPMTKNQINNIGIEQVLAMVLPDEDQLKEYLENPPKGIDPRMWKQAKIDNPDQSKFIPVPLIGFQELKHRIKCQENETETHVHYLTKVEKELNELKQRQASSSAKIMEHRRKFAELSHRILKIIVKQESTRKLGVALSPEEEMLRSKLENMQALVSAPTQFKGRLSELLSQMRMQRNQWVHSGSINEYTLDRDSSDEMKNFLSMQQKAMALLIDTVNKDMKALKIISDGMTQLMRGG